jgi:hypothetical protein
MNTHPAIDPASLGRRIIAEAMRFNGLKEIKDNAVWDKPHTAGVDPEAAELVDMYRSMGWQPGWAHCATFVRGIVCKALIAEGCDPDQLREFKKAMTLGVMQSYENFLGRHAITKDYHSGIPPGSIWLAQNTIHLGQGHTGFVITQSGSTIFNIEANTSLEQENATSAQDRNGDWITTKHRDIRGTGSLVTKGFVTPQSIINLINLINS